METIKKIGTHIAVGFSAIVNGLLCALLGGIFGFGLYIIFRLIVLFLTGIEVSQYLHPTEPQIMRILSYAFVGVGFIFGFVGTIKEYMEEQIK